MPQSRDGAFSTEVFCRYQRSEQALIAAMMEMVVQGVSTRTVRKITETLCGTQFSKRTVSRLCAQLDARVTAFKARSLASAAYPFVLVDAMVITVRQGDAVRPMRLLIAVGVYADGVREIVGFAVAAQESRSSWGDLFTHLLDRGLHGVELVVSDSHKGLVRAIAQCFPSAAMPGASGTERTGPVSTPVAGFAAVDASPAVHQLQQGGRPHGVRGECRGVRHKGGQSRGSPRKGTGRGYGGVNAALEVPAPVAHHQHGGALD